MHPYYHALSTAQLFGGEAADYQAVHDFFDSSKSTLAHFTHRALFHHREGIAIACTCLGRTIRNSAGAEIATGDIATQHFREDLSLLPAAADWLHHLEMPRRLRVATPAADELAAITARRFHTTPAALLPLHRWFLETETWFEDDRHLAMRHHSFGIFEAERTFGVTLPGTRPVPTRVVAEAHVRYVLGRIPAAAEFLRAIKGQAWMAASHKPQHRGLA